MGGSSSKTTVTALSSTISNIAESTVQQCEVNSDQTQSYNEVNSGISIASSASMEQTTDIKSECFQDAQKQAQLQNAIVSAISQSSSAQSVALLGAFGTSKSEAETNLTNIIRNNVTMSSIQKNYNSIRQQQNVNYTNSGISIYHKTDMKQGAKVFAMATLKSMDDAGIFNKISQYVDQTSSAKQENPLDFIAHAIGAVSSSVMYAIIFVVILIVAIPLILIFAVGGMAVAGRSSSEPEPATPTEQATPSKPTTA